MQHSGIPALIGQLDSDLEDVLVNTVNAIRVLCVNNHYNQTELARAGALEPLVEFLAVKSGKMEKKKMAAIRNVFKCRYFKRGVGGCFGGDVSKSPAESTGGGNRGMHRVRLTLNIQ